MIPGGAPRGLSGRTGYSAAFITVAVIGVLGAIASWFLVRRPKEPAADGGG